MLEWNVQQCTRLVLVCLAFQFLAINEGCGGSYLKATNANFKNGVRADANANDVMSNVESWHPHEEQKRAHHLKLQCR